jgi:hypothetical protein
MVAYSFSRAGQHRSPPAEVIDGNVLTVRLDVDANVLVSHDPDACERR